METPHAPSPNDAATGGAEAHGEHRLEILKEAATMALYVAVCLLAALVVTGETDVDHRPTILGVIWGTTLGLALAHWFAFRLSSRLVAEGRVRRTDAELALAQLAGSVVVAVIATVPVLLFDGTDNELDAATWIVIGFIALVGYYVARKSGASAIRSVVWAGIVVLGAAVVVIVKNVLSGH